MPSEFKPLRGAEMIMVERIRQLCDWTAEHDATHRYGEMAIAAAELAVDGTDGIGGRSTKGDDPWDLVAKHGRQGTRPNRIHALTIAGALIAAEIDRLVAAHGEPSDAGD